jgi:hypothetical protein
MVYRTAAGHQCEHHRQLQANHADIDDELARDVALPDRTSFTDQLSMPSQIHAFVRIRLYYVGENHEDLERKVTVLGVETALSRSSCRVLSDLDLLRAAARNLIA